MIYGIRYERMDVNGDRWFDGAGNVGMPFPTPRLHVAEAWLARADPALQPQIVKLIIYWRRP